MTFGINNDLPFAQYVSQGQTPQRMSVITRPAFDRGAANAAGIFFLVVAFIVGFIALILEACFLPLLFLIGFIIAVVCAIIGVTLLILSNKY